MLRRELRQANDQLTFHTGRTRSLGRWITKLKKELALRSTQTIQASFVGRADGKEKILKPLPTPEEIARGDYPRWDGNSEFEKQILVHEGLPEDFHPDEEQAYRITIAALDR